MKTYPFRQGQSHFSIQQAKEGITTSGGEIARWSVYEVISTTLTGNWRLLLGHAATIEEAKTLIYEQATKGMQ